MEFIVSGLGLHFLTREAGPSMFGLTFNIFPKKFGLSMSRWDQNQISHETHLAD